MVGIYDEPERDPREYVVSIAFMCKIVDGEIKAGALVDEVRSLSEAWPKKTGYRV